MKRAALILAALVSLSASAEEAMPPTPWKFGMSPMQVSSVAAGEPYKRFSNGDLETYSALFDGNPENFQFFFRNGKLGRIGIYLYEGDNSAAAAAAKWLHVYTWLARNFTQIRSGGNSASMSGDATAFLNEAVRVAESDGKTQLSPDEQPPYAHIFASFMGRSGGPSRTYLVVLYFDSPVESP